MAEFLPLGSVVLLKGTTKRLMIYGRKETHVESQKVFDYIGCLFPEGYIDDDFVFFFNRNQIGEVIYSGLTDAEEEDFVKTQLNFDNASVFK